MQFFDVGIAIETEDTDFTVGDTVLFMNPCNISGYGYIGSLLSPDMGTQKSFFRSKRTYILLFYYIFFIISSTAGLALLRLADNFQKGIISALCGRYFLDSRRRLANSIILAFPSSFKFFITWSKWILA